MQLSMNPEVGKKAIDEANAHFKIHKNSSDLASASTYESLQELRYIGMCLNESLRIEPPIAVSSTFCFTEAVEICGY